MKLYVGVTDNDWYRFLSERPDIDELNFWQPSGNRNFAVLEPGNLFLFKLHSPLNFIAGGGVFTHFSRCPVELAWDAFGEKNGVASYEGMRRRLAKYRRVTSDSRENFVIGCIILREPFFLPREQWIPCPDDFSKNIVQGKSYEATSGTGRMLFDAVGERLTGRAQSGQHGRDAGWPGNSLERSEIGSTTARSRLLPDAR